MGTRVDEQITSALSVRFDLHGDTADGYGPFKLTMEVHEGDRRSAECLSLAISSELTREQAGKLKACLDAALREWDDAHGAPA